jgi:segregation and condensation protein A
VPIAEAVYDPQKLAQAIGSLLVLPPEVDIRHISIQKVTVSERLAHLRKLLRRGTFNFDEAVAGADRVTVAVTLFSLLELYKQGEATWTQEQPFGEIEVSARLAKSDPYELARTAPEDFAEEQVA